METAASYDGGGRSSRARESFDAGVLAALPDIFVACTFAAAAYLFAALAAELAAAFDAAAADLAAAAAAAFALANMDIRARRREECDARARTGGPCFVLEG